MPGTEATSLLPRHGLSCTLVAHALAICMTGSLLGFDLCVAGAILMPVQRSLHLCYPCEGDYTDADLAACTCFDKQLAISAVSIGATFGALFGGVASDWLGRRRALLVSDVLFALGGACMSYATHDLQSLFFIGRSLVGLALGLGGAASSAYLAEIAPSAWRGRFLEANELCVCTGCLLAYLIAFGLGDARWRLSIGLTSLVALFQLLLLLPLHESPQWLQLNGFAQRAARARLALGIPGDTSSSSTNATVADHVPRAATAAPRVVTLLRALRRARRPLRLALGVAVAHAATAANTVLYYSRDVLQLAGLPDPLLANTAVGVAKFLGVAAALALTDRLGRRTLLLSGTATMVLALTGLALAFANASAPLSGLALVSLLLFILGWDVSWAGLMLTVIAEVALPPCSHPSPQPTPSPLFPQVLPHEIRGAGTGLAYALYWALSFGTAQSLESALSELGAAPTFGGIAVLCIGVMLWTWQSVPETANRKLEHTGADIIAERVPVAPNDAPDEPPDEAHRA